METLDYNQIVELEREFSDSEIIDLSRDIIHRIEPEIRQCLLGGLQNYRIYPINHDTITELYHLKKDRLQVGEVKGYFEMILRQWITQFYFEQYVTIFEKFQESF
jgi:hypothetical protein